ncbi:hypothetical protein RIN67_12765 (plasmid) [Levilactobacillus namurensis]|nr:hypothetical protein [Levilactobacillus namurensis]WNN66792.1 hypothetical protein RIN67_12765 [Levilactobacillus namurensis]
MKINVGDKVSYEDTYAAGIKVVSAGVGKVGTQARRLRKVE